MPLKPQRNMWVLLIIAAVLLLALVAGVAYWMHAYKWFKPLVPPASTPMLTAPKHVDA